MAINDEKQIWRNNVSKAGAMKINIWLKSKQIIMTEEAKKTMKKWNKQWKHEKKSEKKWSKINMVM